MFRAVKRTVSHTAVAAAALATGAGGSAVAADLIDSKDVKNGSLQAKDLSKKARKALKGRRGRRGPVGRAGSMGPRGATGPPGLRGANGAAAASPVFGSGSIPEVGGTYFLRLGGDGITTNEAEAQYPAPRAGVLRNFRVHLSAPPATGRTFSLRVNGQQTSLTCAVATDATTCSSTGPRAVNRGDLLSVREDSPKAAPAVATFTFELAPN